ncbi:MAG: serine hydrolase [Gammaproteobacteria bacterium]|nr:serine hydrolase [Gammaproteobacteria bacterium]
MSQNPSDRRFPAAGQWPGAEPEAFGFDTRRLRAAVALAESAETRWPRELGSALNADPANNEPAPWNEVLGPTLDRGGPNGMIVRGGHCVASWGDTRRVEMTFSATKSYLAIVAGLAVADGLIGSLDERLADDSRIDGFESAQNCEISWRHLLQQTSEWEGELWSKPDLVDRNRQVGVDADNSRKGTHRDLGRPGSHWEYNDVRVNRLSLSLMQLFRRPLPEVLDERVMQPIGASRSWAWHGYRNAAVEIDGRLLQGVPGGAHWGGGLFIASEDHARVGWLVANDGVWAGRRLLPEGWVEQMWTPCALKPDYGFLWWLNTNRHHYASAPESSRFMMGAGQHLVWVDPALDLVVVMRWVHAARSDEIMAAILAAQS